MTILNNQKHEMFAQAIAKGESGSAAYSKVYGVSEKSATEAASRLSRNVKVRARVRELQEKAADETVLALRKKRVYLWRVVMTPIDDVVGTDLHQGYTNSGAPIMPDKLRAIELDSKLAGDFMEKVEVKADGLSELLDSIRAGGGRLNG